MTARIGKLDTPVARLASAPSSWHGYDYPVLDDGDETTPTSIRCSAVAQLIGADYTVKVLRAADVTETFTPTDPNAHTVSGSVPVIGGAHMVVTPMPELCGCDEDGVPLCPNPELDADVLDEYEASRPFSTIYSANIGDDTIEIQRRGGTLRLVRIHEDTDGYWDDGYWHGANGSSNPILYTELARATARPPLGDASDIFCALVLAAGEDSPNRAFLLSVYDELKFPAAWKKRNDFNDTANAYWNLGKCGDSYTPIQNMALCELLDTFLDACTEYAQANPDSGLTLPRFETMGTLDNRRRFWAQVTLGGFGVALSPDLRDDVVAYLLVTTSHDGRYAAQVSIVFVRVVCNNTLNAAMDTEDRVFTIKHVGDVQMKVTNASRGIEWLVKTMRDEKARLESYATTYLTDDDARLLCRAFFGFSSRQDWLSDRAIRLYIDDSADAELRGNDTAPTGTVYRLLQALTQTIEETQAGKDADAEAARISSATARVSGEYRGRGFTPTAANALCASVVARYDEVIAAARKDADAEHQKRLAAELKRQEKAAAKEIR